MTCIACGVGCDTPDSLLCVDCLTRARDLAAWLDLDRLSTGLWTTSGSTP
jgi:hypothetical protein